MLSPRVRLVPVRWVWRWVSEQWASVWVPAMGLVCQASVMELGLVLSVLGLVLSVLELELPP